MRKTLSQEAVARVEPAALGACPRCGCAVLWEREFTVDVYSAGIECRGGSDVDAYVELEWLKGIENREELLGCARCGASVGAADLIAASPGEVARAEIEFSGLKPYAPWEGDRRPGHEVQCAECGGARFIVELEREAGFTSLYVSADGWFVRSERRFLAPWSVECLDAHCRSCRRSRYYSDPASGWGIAIPDE
jgi:hypothetical protein